MLSALRRANRGKLDVVEAKGARGLADRAKNRMLGLDHAVACDHLLVLERGSDVVHGRGGYPGGRQDLEPTCRRLRAEDRLEDREQLVAVSVATREGGEALVGAELGPPERAAELQPEPMLGAGDDEPAVARGEVLKRHHRLVRRVRPPHGLVAALVGGSSGPPVTLCQPARPWSE